MHCGRCHDLCRLHLHPASVSNTTTCLADGHGRQGLLRMCTVGHKTAVEGTFPFPLVAEAVLCMSLSQGCTAEYRTVLEWSTGDTSAGPATHTVRSAVLQNALPHQLSTPVLSTCLCRPVKSVSQSLSISQGRRSGGQRRKAVEHRCSEMNASTESAHHRSSSRQQGSHLSGRFSMAAFCPGARIPANKCSTQKEV